MSGVVVNLPSHPKQVAASKAVKKWGKQAWEVGHTSVPTILFQGQHRLGLNAVQLCVLLQLADFWWEHARRPFPTLELLSQRIGLSMRHIRRVIRELEDAGFVKRVARRAPGRGKISNEYDLSGLVEKLGGLAPQFLQEKEDRTRRPDERS